MVGFWVLELGFMIWVSGVIYFIFLTKENFRVLIMLVRLMERSCVFCFDGFPCGFVLFFWSSFGR